MTKANQRHGSCYVAKDSCYVAKSRATSQSKKHRYSAERQPATAGLLKSAVVALCGQADALGDAGDEEAALVLDEAAARTRQILRRRLGPPDTQAAIAAAAVGLAATAESLDEAGDHEAAGLFIDAAGRLVAILDGRTGPCDLRRGPRDSYKPKSKMRQAPPETRKNKAKTAI